MKKHLKFIACLQTIGIILVVLGHSFHEYPDGEMGKSLLLYNMLYSFRMPLFIFVSGFLMIFTTRMRDAAKKVSVKKFTLGKIKRLLIPFMTLTLVTFLPRTMMSGMADDNIALNLDSLWRGFVYGDELIIPFFWFIQSSFVLLTCTYIILTLCEKAKIPHIVIFLFLLILAAVLPLTDIDFPAEFSLYRTVNLALYFIAGCCYARWADKIDRLIDWTSPVFLLSACACWCILYFTTLQTPLTFICSLAGIAMCISIAKIIERRDWHFLDHLSGANYMIFLLSWYCNVASQQVLHHFVTLPWWVYTLLSLFSGIYIPLLAYRYLLNHKNSRWVRLTAFLLGQSLDKTPQKQKN